MSNTNIAIVGLGTVGTGVVMILNRHADLLARRAGSQLVIKHVVVRDKSKPRTVPLAPQQITDDVGVVVADPDVDVVVEAMGGVNQASSVVRQAITAGKSVVTANKALIAEQGPELFRLAYQAGVSIAFDAAVAGGIPVVTNINQCLTANRILSIRGILNGTCNFILSQMELQRTYEAALRKAQQLRYAEADPTMDVDGTDAAQKLAILTRLGFGTVVDWRQIPRLGIQQIAEVDVRAAGELGYRIRLLAVARREDDADQIRLHVGPTLVPSGGPLADVQVADNGIVIVGDAVGELMLRGPGAGQLPTASAMVADLIDTVTGRALLTFQRSHDLSLPWQVPSPQRDVDRYYLRLRYPRSSGHTEDIAGVLVAHGVSVGSVLQPESEASDESGHDHLVILTHRATSQAIEAAVAALQSLPTVVGPIIRMRIDKA